MSRQTKRWRLRPQPSRALIGALAEACDGNATVATLLYHRLADPELPEDEQRAALQEATEHFLHDSYGSGQHDALLLKGMQQASERLADAIANGEPIAVYGDFDTDGVTAVALLMQVIPTLGGTIRPYIPHREREGYGLNLAAIEDLVAEGVGLLITVDCGITNVAEVARARELGLDVIVTDHHRPPAELPPALAIINPKQPGCTYPFKQLVGVGIAFKLVQALVKELTRRGHNFQRPRGRDMLDLVALGTVADMGPLQGENRVLVRAGLEALRDTERPGLRALIDVAGLAQRQIDSTAIGFMLGPRLNAAGRLDDAVDAYQLLLASDLAEARLLAEKLNVANRQRQEMTRQVTEQANRQAEASGQHEQRIIVLSHPDYPAGVVGLVAARLVERWARPVILIAQGAEYGRGSARSIPGFNIHQALTNCSDLFVRFGGHSAAAGFTLANEQIEAFTARIQALVAAELDATLLQPTLLIDAVVPLRSLTRTFYDLVARCEPFGQANERPLLLSRSVRVLDWRTTGSEHQHLKLTVADEADGAQASESPAKGMTAIGFGLGTRAAELARYLWIDIVYTLEAHTWNSTSVLQLNVKDFGVPDTIITRPGCL